MAKWLTRLYEWLIGLFWTTSLDIAIVGLQNAGKTSLLRVLAGEDFTADSIPTVGYAVKEFRKGHVSLKCWDLAGQPRFRTIWERYCQNVNAIMFVVDSNDKQALEVAKEELEMLLDKPSLEQIPLLVLSNKSDLENHMQVDEIIEGLGLKAYGDRELSCYGISAKTETNLEAVLEWLIKHGEKS